MGAEAGQRHGDNGHFVTNDLDLLVLLAARSNNGGGGGSFSLTPFLITGPGTFSPTLTQARWLNVDTTAGTATINMPAPTQNALYLVKDVTGQSGVNPITLVAPATWTVEDPSNPGHQVASGVLSDQGAVVGYIAVTATKQFIRVIF
jgi:hypothetical protein